MTQMCAVTGCELEWDLDSESDLGNVLAHYLDSHPDNHRLESVMNSYVYDATCRNCESQFWAVMSVSKGKVWVEANCDDCAEEEELLNMYVQQLNPSDVTENAEPFDAEKHEGI